MFSEESPSRVSKWYCTIITLWLFQGRQAGSPDKAFAVKFGIIVQCFHLKIVGDLKINRAG
jgi:hypothetical protein